MIGILAHVFIHLFHLTLQMRFHFVENVLEHRRDRRSFGLFTFGERFHHLNG